MTLWKFKLVHERKENLWSMWSPCNYLHKFSWEFVAELNGSWGFLNPNSSKFQFYFIFQLKFTFLCLLFDNKDQRYYLPKIEYKTAIATIKGFSHAAQDIKKRKNIVLARKI